MPEDLRPPHRLPPSDIRGGWPDQSRPLGPVAWRDPFNGDTERLAADAKRYNERMCSHMPEHQPMGDLEIVNAPKNLDFIQIQKDLQEHIGRTTAPAYTHEEMIERFRDEQLAITNELAEIWDQLPWKHWKVDHRARRPKMLDPHTLTEIQFELIDIFHFFLNMCIATGMDWQRFCDLYMTKMRENHDRQDRGY